MSNGKDIRMLENILEKEILWAGIRAADPAEAVRRSLSLEEDRLTTVEGNSFEVRRAFVLSAGKAAGSMTHAAQQLLGEKLASGLVITKDDHSAGPQGMETLYASHPEPDERGVEAARRAQDLVESLGEGDLLLALISGGASALLADPVPPIELEDLKQLTQALLKSGADIEEINTVRKHVSTLKGGGLVQLAAPAATLALLLSDVVGDESSAIASGLTTPDPTTLEDAQQVLERYQIDPPQSIATHLREAAETPKSSDELFEQVVNVHCIEQAQQDEVRVLIGGNRITDNGLDNGYYLEPTILTDVKAGTPAALDEIFGPVLVVIPAESFEEALAINNEVQYGLTSSIFTDNMEWAQAFAKSSEAGMVHVNNGTVSEGHMPFGGVKQSGSGPYSIGATNKDFYTNLKVVYHQYSYEESNFPPAQEVLTEEDPA